MAEDDRDLLKLTVKWNGKDYIIRDLKLTDSLLCLKDRVFKETNVLPCRQKLIGFKVKGALVDEKPLSELKVRNGMKLMMMGTQEETLNDVINPSKELTSIEVVDDFDIEIENIVLDKREENLAKIEKRVKSYTIKELNPPREGKKLLVLDIDYTLFDHRSVAETGAELMRPYLHEFLTSAYQDYDIVIWSATSMRWIEAKMDELGVTGNMNFKIMFMMDSGGMITVNAPNYGLVETKPLGVIWGKYPQFSANNSIMFDDLRRNFLMNPKCGLKIRPFRKASVNRNKDEELLKLSKYLKKIADLETFENLNHDKWENLISDF